MTYWKANGAVGLRNILQANLGMHMVQTHNRLVRDQFLKGAKVVGNELFINDRADFGALTSTDKMDIELTADIQLGMQMRGVAGALMPGAGGAREAGVFCITTPGVIYDIQQDSAWIDVQKYANPQALVKYEVGAYKGVRFVAHPDLILYNAGELIYQSTMTASRKAGDGAPPHGTRVDGVFNMGQSTGMVNYITVSLTEEVGDIAADLSVGDFITIHRTRTSDYGVTDGVDPYEGGSHVRRVMSIDAVNGRIVLDKPLMEDFTTDLGAGVFGYVSKGLNVNSSIFIGGPNGVIAGVGNPIRMHTPPPIDDFLSIQRFTWDDYIGYTPWEPDVFEVIYSSGSFRYKGKKV